MHSHLCLRLLGVGISESACLAVKLFDPPVVAGVGIATVSFYECGERIPFLAAEVASAATSTEANGSVAVDAEVDGANCLLVLRVHEELADELISAVRRHYRSAVEASQRQLIVVVA